MAEHAAPEVKADAKDRAYRTLLQGLLVDVLAAVGSSSIIVLGSLEGNELLTTAGWTLLGTSVLKSVLVAAASYLSRLAIPPKTEE